MKKISKWMGTAVVAGTCLLGTQAAMAESKFEQLVVKSAMQAQTAEKAAETITLTDGQGGTAVLTTNNSGGNLSAEATYTNYNAAPGITYSGTARFNGTLSGSTVSTANLVMDISMMAGGTSVRYRLNMNLANNSFSGTLTLFSPTEFTIDFGPIAANTMFDWLL
ncbi:hypothetical protein [Parachitinimonas caeni]|uniref:Uncharacterized protein n=1 Tax=Parachitinimonas caeni TaxID=3031301 RepID=A0ABT7DS40_9NEIS|nr:hypothetical protein [Parachitinimonas caeni]MDK2122774.1 hypothetical protein [Parachitinimonas caeni]